jgi:uncharacterized protein
MSPTSRRFFLSSSTLFLTSCAVWPRIPRLAEVGIYSAGQGSAFLPYAQALANEYNAKRLKASALESTGSIENLRKVNAEPQRLATAFIGTAFEAITGNATWTLGQKLEQVRALFPMYETSFQIATLKRSGFDRLTSLDGKRVGVGPAGGPAESYFRGLVDSINMSVTPVNGSPIQLASDLLAGKIDALWQGASVPIPALKQVADNSEAEVFGLSESELLAMLNRFPFLTKTTIQPNTYRGQSKALSSVSAWNFVVANAELDVDDAYWLTKTAFDGAQRSGANIGLAGTRPSNAIHNRVLKFHPGAIKFYREIGQTLAVNL